ncbi:MAG: adenylyl-sulfate kinase, partial [Pseudomonadota bacterium]
DARNGIQVQTKRHAFLVSLLGIRHVVLAVNKIDLVGFDEGRFEAIKRDFQQFARSFDFDTLEAIPISARYGHNVVERSDRTPWYTGPALLSHLETIEVRSELSELAFRMPVQWVNRPNLDFRGYSGTIASGRVRQGDEVVVAASGKPAKVSRIVTMDGDLEEAEATEAVTLVLDREIDVSRGDLFVPPSHRPEVADQFAAHIVWMAEDEMYPGRPYLMKIGTRTVTAQVTDIKHRIDVNTFDQLAAKELGLNEVGFCNVSLSQEVAFDPYEANRETGSFILVDRLTNATVGAGMIWFALRRATNIHWQALDVGKSARSALKGQKPGVLWFTGLSGSGKSTIANLVEKRLHAQGRHTYILDGDNVRHGLNRDLGFTEADRVENIRRVGEVAKLMTDAGLVVVTAFISPFRADRDMVRALFGEGQYHEVFVNTPLSVAEERDPKGLYKKARAGEIPNFTGIGSPYEAPDAPELNLDTTALSAEESADRIIAMLGL